MLHGYFSQCFCPYSIGTWNFRSCFPDYTQKHQSKSDHIGFSHHKQIKHVSFSFRILMQKEEKHTRSEISLKDYEQMTILGEASFGQVRLVKKKSTGKYSCAKIMNKDELIRSQQVDHINNQYRILSLASHPFIVLPLSIGQNSTGQLKTPSTSTRSWSTQRMASFSLISVNRTCSTLTRQRSPSITNFLYGACGVYIRVPAKQEHNLAGPQT